MAVLAQVLLYLPMLNRRDLEIGPTCTKWRLIYRGLFMLSLTRQLRLDSRLGFFAVVFLGDYADSHMLSSA